ncbi:MAG: malate synthase A [Bradyrhizobiaceae bacterium]|nr:malate synthase A [Bradyrhizobiaceae bacterium]
MARRARKAANKKAKKSGRKAAKKGAKKAAKRKTAKKKLVSRAVKKPARKAGKKTARKSAAKKPAVATPQGVTILGALGPRYDEILTKDALGFVAELHRHFNPKRRDLLLARNDMQHRFDGGALPDFLPETRSIREENWKVAPIPADLQDRRVEITGPVDRKMVINALNSGASVFMADFEDACSPYWANIIEGQINLKDRWNNKLSFVDPDSKKSYKLGAKPAVLLVRPRGWHLNEEHVRVDGRSISASLFDFGLYFFHNAKKATAAGSGPYFYLPKLETHREAKLWNDVFNFAQEQLGIPRGTIKCTVLIETLPAAFEMDEILHELRQHIAGLNAGRWDYIFSFIKRLGKNKRFLTPDRASMTMDKAFLLAYAKLLVKTCHRRGAFAMGGMAAQIPARGNPEVNQAAFAKVRLDKEREAMQGHDGTWVAHPDLVPIAKEVFDRLMPAPNQVHRLNEDVNVTRDDLLQVHEGKRTEAGLRENIRVGIQYIEAWLGGRGAVPLYNLMEDAATAEISRAQIWQWLYHRARLDDGREVTPELFREVLEDEMAKVRQAVGPTTYDAGHFKDATELFMEMSLALQFEEFLTIPAYRLIVKA